MDENYEARRQAVKKLRAKSGLSQTKLAALAAIDPGTLSRFEGNKQNIKLTTLMAIEHALESVLASQNQQPQRGQSGLASTSLLAAMAAHSMGGGATQRTGSLSDASLPSYDLVQELSELREQVKILTKMNTKLQESVEALQAIVTLDEEESAINKATIEGFLLRQKKTAATTKK